MNLRKVSQLDAPKVSSYLEKIRNEDTSIDSFIHEIELLGCVYMIGGAIRDICNDVEPRDLDIIIDCHQYELRSVVTCHNHKINNFGGAKLYFNNIKIDVWTMESNWAFKEKIIQKHEDNIHRGAFYNFDSIVVNLTTHKLYSDIYNKAIDDNCLDIIIDDKDIESNPSPATNILRAYYIECKYGLKPSIKLRSYIYNWLISRENPAIELKKSEKRHFEDHFESSLDEYYDFIKKYLSYT